MQLVMGLGAAASKTGKPAQTHLRSLTNHIAFGAGLYRFGLVAGRWV